VTWAVHTAAEEGYVGINIVPTPEGEAAEVVRLGVDLLLKTCQELKVDMTDPRRVYLEVHGLLETLTERQVLRCDGHQWHARPGALAVVRRALCL